MRRGGYGSATSSTTTGQKKKPQEAGEHLGLVGVGSDLEGSYPMSKPRPRSNVPERYKKLSLAMRQRKKPRQGISPDRASRSMRMLCSAIAGPRCLRPGRTRRRKAYTHRGAGQRRSPAQWRLPAMRRASSPVSTLASLGDAVPQRELTPFPSA